MKVGVVGGGTMGVGIAQVFASAEGYEVVMCGVREGSSEKGRKKIDSSLAALVGKGKMEQSKMDATLGRLSAGRLEDLA